MTGPRPAAALPPQSEASFQKAVVQLAILLRWKPYHPWLSIRSTAGWPDLALCRPPRLLLVELKREKGALSRQQQEWIDALSACPGVEVYVWKPSHWDHITQVLR